MNPMVLFFFAFFVIWILGFVATVGAPRTGNEPPALFFLFPVIFFGIFLIGPMLVSGWLGASRTHYTLTDKRIVIDGFRRRTELDLSTLPFLELERSIFGTTSIYFAPRTPYESWAGFGGWGGRTAPAFRAIDGADAVYELISRTRDEARAK